MDFKEFLNEGSKPNVKLKKYSWNEPVLKKRKWDDSDYNDDQKEHISAGRVGYDDYGNIDDLDPDQYEADQMKWISEGRGSNDDYGNIDDLDPKKYYSSQMRDISMDRAT